MKLILNQFLKKYVPKEKFMGEVRTYNIGCCIAAVYNMAVFPKTNRIY
jgi:hypothetical protein